jgi:hypothetical protein
MRKSEDRFWKKAAVRRGSGCWEWRGVKSSEGEGRFMLSIPLEKTGTTASHRVAYYYATGDWPGEFLVIHKCKSVDCVNPEHLFLGSIQDKADNDVKKGVHRHGNFEQYRHAILTQAQVFEILASDETPAVLGERYGVVPGAICNVRSGLTWNWLTKRRQA